MPLGVFLFVDDAECRESHGRVFHLHHLLNVFPVARDDDLVTSPAAEFINDDDRITVVLTANAKRLCNQQPPTIHRRMLDRRDHSANDFRNLHLKKLMVDS